MGKRSRRRNRGDTPAAPVSTTDYADPDGNVLTLRDELSEGTRKKIHQLDSVPAASGDDRWQRREGLLFARLGAPRGTPGGGGGGSLCGGGWGGGGRPPPCRSSRRRSCSGATGWPPQTSAA